MEQGQLFEIGQEVTPKDGSWNIAFGDKQWQKLPKIGKIYTVKEYKFKIDRWYIKLKEIPDNWQDQNGFAPVLGTSQLE